VAILLGARRRSGEAMAWRRVAARWCERREPGWSCEVAKAKEGGRGADLGRAGSGRVRSGQGREKGRSGRGERESGSGSPGTRDEPNLPLSGDAFKILRDGGWVKKS
jgi:hypothetical protein